MILVSDDMSQLGAFPACPVLQCLLQFDGHIGARLVVNNVVMYRKENIFQQVMDPK